MKPDIETLLDSLLDYEPEHREPLADLVRLAGEQLKLVACVLAQGTHRSYRVKDLENAISAASRSVQPLTPESNRALCRSFLQISFYVLAASWGDETLDVFGTESITNEDARNTLLSWLELLEPAVLKASLYRGESGVTVRNVRSSLGALDAGEMPSLFKPGPRKGRERNAHTLATARLELLELHIALCDAGMSRKQAEELTYDAARAGADTRRKWTASIRKILKEAEVKQIKSDVRALVGKDGIPSVSEIAAALLAAGTRYKQALKYKQ